MHLPPHAPTRGEDTPHAPPPSHHHTSPSSSLHANRHSHHGLPPAHTGGFPGVESSSPKSGGEKYPTSSPPSASSSPAAHPVLASLSLLRTTGGRSPLPTPDEAARASMAAVMAALQAQVARIEAENAELNAEVEALTQVWALQESAHACQDSRLQLLLEGRGEGTSRKRQREDEHPVARLLDASQSLWESAEEHSPFGNGRPSRPVVSQPQPHSRPQSIPRSSSPGFVPFASSSSSSSSTSTSTSTSTSSTSFSVSVSTSASAATYGRNPAPYERRSDGSGELERTRSRPPNPLQTLHQAHNPISGIQVFNDQPPAKRSRGLPSMR